MIKPLGKNILIERDEQKEETATGIIIPKEAGEKPLLGIVKAVGNGVKEVKVGDRVLFKKYAPDEVRLDELNYLVCEEEDILAIVGDEK